MSQDLYNLPVILLDCQTTSSSPRTGHLLEFAWRAASAAALAGCSPDSVRSRMEGGHLSRADPGPEGNALPPVESRLTALPRGLRIPAPISRLTGISLRELSGAMEPGEVWREFVSAVSVANGRADPAGNTMVASRRAGTGRSPWI